jgi:hypothetical protein
MSTGTAQLGRLHDKLANQVAATKRLEVFMGKPKTTKS